MGRSIRLLNRFQSSAMIRPNPNHLRSSLQVIILMNHTLRKRYNILRECFKVSVERGEAVCDVMPDDVSVADDEKLEFDSVAW